jgi:hypothetical protein
LRFLTDRRRRSGGHTLGETGAEAGSVIAGGFTQIHDQEIKISERFY